MTAHFYLVPWFRINGVVSQLLNLVPWYAKRQFYVLVRPRKEVPRIDIFTCLSIGCASLSNILHFPITFQLTRHSVHRKVGIDNLISVSATGECFRVVNSC